jgi:hypothetical protein
VPLAEQLISVAEQIGRLGAGLATWDHGPSTMRSVQYQLTHEAEVRLK